MSALRRVILASATVALALTATACSSQPATVCDGEVCSGPAHVDPPIDSVVSVLVTFGIVPVVPGSAGGPARIVHSPFGD